MKIGIIAHLKFPIIEPFAGGLEMHTYALAKGLIRRGHEVVLFATENSDPCLNIDNMHVSTLDYRTAYAFEPNTDYFSEQFVQEHHAYLNLMLELAGTDFDIIHNNSLNYLPVSMAHTITTPMVTTLHTPPFSWIQSAVRCEQKYGKIRYTTVSRQNAFSWNPYVTDCEIIYNGIDLHQWQYSAVAVPGTAIWFGRIVPEKGTHLAIRAAQLAGMKMTIAGPACDEDYFHQEIAPLLSEDIKYVGHKTHDELVDLLGSASVFLCTPCWEEPFGLVVAESLACGTPVAAFKRGALPELINNKTGRLAPAGDVAALAVAAREAAQLNRANCRAFAEAHCSLDSMIDSYVDLYSRIRDIKPMSCQAV